MFNRLIILALLFLASEKTSSQSFQGFLMTFSDALPVQWWLANCSTYNQHEAAGVHHKCFFHPWECSDEIKTQFLDDAGQNYTLLVLDEDEDVIDELDVDEISSGVYYIAYTPAIASPGVCDEKIQLQMRKNAGSQGISLPTLAGWANSGGAGDPWTLGASPSIVIDFAGTTSEILFVDFAFIVGVSYSITVNFTSTANLIGLFTIRALDSSNNTIFSESTSGVGSGSNVSDTLTFTATSSTTRIGISLTLALAGTITINSTIATRSVGSEVVVANTDWLDVRLDHPSTVLLTYTNHRNFAGINYESSSPDNDLSIRIPAIFFHQRFPEEDEVMELSDSLLTLNGTLKKQRRLDVDYVPYYFHEKIKLILKHQFISMLDRYWVKEEGYEIAEGDRKWPIKTARCWLSEKDFVHRNIL